MSAAASPSLQTRTSNACQVFAESTATLMASASRISPPPFSTTKTISSANTSPTVSPSRANPVLDLSSRASSDSSSDPDLDSDSDVSSSSSSSGSSSDEPPVSGFGPVSDEYLQSLLEKARANIKAKACANGKGKEKATFLEADEILLQDEDDGDYLTKELPPLDPGDLPPGYFDFDAEKPEDGIPPTRDFEAEILQSVSSIPSPPEPPELGKDGKKLTKKEVKALKQKNKKPGWFDLPTPDTADLPRLHREVEALRLRNSLDPKRFYRKEPGEGKGIKGGLPKQFAIGTILPTDTPFGTASAENLTRAERKRTLVDELVDDSEAKRYAKKKFEDLQSTRGARGRGTFKKRFAGRKPKW